jgi:eukaryotic-like serine/threonine-protein kinase
MRLWIAELERLEQRRSLPLVGNGRNWAAVWSANGDRLVFVASGDYSGRKDSIYWRRADGSGEAEHLIDARAAEGIYADDRRLAFITLTGTRDYGISVMDMSTKAVTRLIDYPGSEQHSSRISPDGRWITYVSNETGQQEVWLEPLPQSGQRLRITSNGGRHPLWSPDGSHLFYDQGGKMYRVRLSLGAGPPKASEPETLPIQGFQQGDLRRQFDLMPDGQRLLMLFPLAAPTSPGRP